MRTDTSRNYVNIYATTSMHILSISLCFLDFSCICYFLVALTDFSGLYKEMKLVYTLQL